MLRLSHMQKFHFFARKFLFAIDVNSSGWANENVDPSSRREKEEKNQRLVLSGVPKKKKFFHILLTFKMNLPRVPFGMRAHKIELNSDFVWKKKEIKREKNVKKESMQDERMQNFQTALNKWI